MLLPVLFEDEQELLRHADREDGEQGAAAAVQDARDGFHEGRFALGARDVCADAERRFGNQAVNFEAFGDCCRDQVPVVLAAIVAGEEDVEAGDFDEVHTCAQDVAGRVWRDADAVMSVCRIEGDGLDLRESGEDVVFVEELVDAAAVVGTG